MFGLLTVAQLMYGSERCGGEDLKAIPPKKYGRSRQRLVPSEPGLRRATWLVLDELSLFLNERLRLPVSRAPGRGFAQLTSCSVVQQGGQAPSPASCPVAVFSDRRDRFDGGG